MAKFGFVRHSANAVTSKMQSIFEIALSEKEWK